VAREYTTEELAQAVRDWCDKHRMTPANGQAAEDITERTIRYYRTLGLLDKPVGSYTKTFSDKHRLQLIAVRVYQAQGIPLRRIRDELYGKSEEDLMEFEKLAAKQGKAAAQYAGPFEPPAAGESWAVAPLNDGFMLLSRDGRQLPRQVIERINEIISSAGAGGK
jgi:DNA-binding transcriptional MerR regulator